MTEEKKGNEKKKQSKIPLVLSKDFESSIKNIRVFSTMAAQSQQRMVAMMADAMKMHQESINLYLPSINALLVFGEYFRESMIPNMKYLNDFARTTKLYNSMWTKKISEAFKMLADFTIPYENLSTALLPHIESMREIQNNMVPLIELSHIVDSTWLDIERNDRAFDVILIEMISSLKLELDEKDKKIEKLIELINNLLERNKDYYVV